jgi:hypothetical protein
MAETLVEFDTVLRGPDHVRHGARACGREREDGLWEGWIEFPRLSGGAVADGATLRTGRETTQPNRDDLIYWATGLTDPYLDGALSRVLTPAPSARVRGPRRAARASWDTPTPPNAAAAHPVLDPFQVYHEGADILRAQLHALSRDQLRNIVVGHSLSELEPHRLDTLEAADLVRLIVTAVEARER